MKAEFCLNSRRWIEFMFNPPKSCPYSQENLLKCESCGYYEKREVNSSYKRKKNILRSYK